MDGNPVSVFVVAAGMLMVFLGLMQYMSSMGKNGMKRESDLFDKWQTAKAEVSDLKEENDRLADTLERTSEALKEANKLIEKWAHLAKRFHQMYLIEKKKNEV